jgi:predicted ATPase/DNA-binding winged helix-turn-helix (wHTH) protein
MPASLYRDFELRPEERRLIVRGEGVPVGARAFDLLVALVEHSDRVVTKNELLDLVWPNLVVEENNLQVQISALRKLLGPGAIATVPGRGYRLTAEPAVPVPLAATSIGAGDDESSGANLHPSGGNIPEHVPPLYGREAAVQGVRELVESSRLVTITGSSGIGKTRLALSVAHQLRGAYPGGAWMIELASISEAAQVVPAVAQLLAVRLAGRRNPAEELAAALRNQTLLLLLDNCEHLVEPVSQLAFQLLAAAPGVHMLATTQELLRIHEERVYKLPPLAVPAESDRGDPASFGAVQLFVERVQALDRNFALDARNTAAVVDVCRQLDGIPLAIELAAARVPGLGVQALKDRLGERFRLLTGGARVSLRRHQTLRAALDWSHGLLGEDERKVFRRLAVFNDGFCVEGAQLVCPDEALDAWAVLDVLNALVDKSLVLVDGGARPRYRFLESTRAYAMEKLAEADETNASLRRHAEGMRRICELATKQRDIDWLWAEMNNVRVAYGWAIGPGGADELAIALATLSAMVLAVSGLAHEAMQRMLEVEPKVEAGAGPELAARFWQWLGRGGVEGRLPTSRCLEAFARAEAMFRTLGNGRHVHACLRMRAEAMVATEDLAGALAALREAEAMEHQAWPLADRMRRLRVHGLLDAVGGRYEESLGRFERVLQWAQMRGVLRYELILMADIARVHLDRGDFAEAAAQFHRLADKARVHHAQGLTRAQALAGLVAALVGAGRTDEAAAAAMEGVPLLRRCGIFLAYCDVHAWLLARLGQYLAAARLLGAADEFHRTSETARDSARRMARSEVVKALAASFSQTRVQDWMQEGASWDEGSIATVLESALADAAGTRETDLPMLAAADGDAVAAAHSEAGKAYLALVPRPGTRSA